VDALEESVVVTGTELFAAVDEVDEFNEVGALDGASPFDRVNALAGVDPLDALDAIDLVNGVDAFLGAARTYGSFSEITRVDALDGAVVLAGDEILAAGCSSSISPSSTPILTSISSVPGVSTTNNVIGVDPLPA